MTDFLKISDLVEGKIYKLKKQIHLFNYKTSGCLVSTRFSYRDARKRYTDISGQPFILLRKEGYYIFIAMLNDCKICKAHKQHIRLFEELKKGKNEETI